VREGRKFRGRYLRRAVRFTDAGDDRVVVAPTVRLDLSMRLDLSGPFSRKISAFYSQAL
jgi:hypothetical protein